MTDTQGRLFDERFLDRHAGSIIHDPAISIVELVANAWDAWATRVEVIWPEQGGSRVFSITDNGKGLTETEFRRRWGTFDYNKHAEEGPISAPPPELAQFAGRRAYGRNGRGRHAAFRFGDPYRVRTWRDGVELIFEVRRDAAKAFDFELVSRREVSLGHGTEISTGAAAGTGMTSQQVRETLGTRFLSDPNFTVVVDGTVVTFEDVPSDRLSESDVEVPGIGTASLTVIDTQKADKTTRQHGIAWWVDNRLVGNPGWQDFDLDGRSSEAKRFLFIVRADFLADSGATLADWSGFHAHKPEWRATREAVFARIHEFLAGVTADRRREAKASVKASMSEAVSRLAPVSRERWNDFVDLVVDTCPSINAEEVEQVAGVLAKLEMATSKYGLIRQLHEMKPGDLDELHALLSDWTVRTAKLALDEIQGRLKLIAELDLKLRDETLSEVGHLQPLFEKSLWVFGPEFESLEFTSNRGMTRVIRDIFGAADTGSLLRPDFVIVPDGSAGFYSRDSHDLGHDVDGVARLVIAEIKKAGVTVGAKEKDQPWRYVKELRAKGLVTEATDVTCYVLGSQIDPNETGVDSKGDRVKIIAMTYNTFVRRAEKRMLGLRNQLRDAPFLAEVGINTVDFLEPKRPLQATLDFTVS